MGTKRTYIIKKGIIVKSVSPWESPVVVVAKKLQPGKPPIRKLCVDYRVLNSVLPPVTKAHSKAKGALTVVAYLKLMKYVPNSMSHEYILLSI